MRCNVEPELFDAEQTVQAYKDLAKVERAFRSMKTVDLKVRPIYAELVSIIRQTTIYQAFRSGTSA